MDSNYTKLIEAIRAFCLTVDHWERYQCLEWLGKIEQLLSLIDKEMAQLELDADCSFFVLPDLEYRFQMFCRLKAFLGEVDGYPLAGDDVDDPEDYTGSLADDITELYFELRRGLKLYEAEAPNCLPALTLWYSGYLLHWQDHLLDAQNRIRALLY